MDNETFVTPFWVKRGRDSSSDSISFMTQKQLFDTKPQRGEILYSRGSISSCKTVYIDFQEINTHDRPVGVMD